MSIVSSVVFYGIMFSLNPTLLPVLCRCFKPCHLSSFTLMGPHSDANNYTLRCNKIKSLLLTTDAFFLSFLTLCLLKTFLLYSSTATSLYMYLAFSLLYGRTFLQSN